MRRWIKPAALLGLILVVAVLGADGVLRGTPTQPVPEPGPAAVPEPQPEPEPERPVRFTLVAVGDLMVHTDQLLDARQEGEAGYDFTHCFAQVADDLAEGFAIGNLETVLAGEERGYSDFPFFNTPDSFAEALRASGFDFVVTANNHCMDKGESGLRRTLQVLDEIGLGHTGTFASQQERDTVCVVEVEGVRIAILSCTFSNGGIAIAEGSEYLVNIMNEAQVRADLAAAAALEPDLVLVMPHMGNEYELAPRDPFVVWMNLMFTEGADLILAHHPHVLQRMEVRELGEQPGQRTALVHYSLGNFISSQRFDTTDMSMILKLDFYKPVGEKPLLERVRLVPTWVQFRDDSGASCIRVLPIADAIRDYESGGNTLRLREQDLSRLYQAHSWITRLYLGESPTDGDMQREYVFYENPALAAEEESTHV